MMTTQWFDKKNVYSLLLQENAFHLPDEVDEDEEERPLHCWEDVLIDFVLFMIIISVSVCYKESSQINFKNHC